MAQYPNVTDNNSNTEVILDYIYRVLSGTGSVLPAGVFEEDTAQSDGDPGYSMLAVRKNSPAITTSVEGDYSNLFVDAYGLLYTKAGGFTKEVIATFDRPANTDAYEAGDVVGTNPGTVITFSDVARYHGGSGVIVSAVLIEDSNNTTKATYDLFLFRESPTAQDDEVAFAPSDSEMDELIDVITFDSADVKVGNSTSGAGGNCVYPNKLSYSIPFYTANASEQPDIYGVLVTRTVFTGISGAGYTIKLGILQD